MSLGTLNRVKIIGDRNVFSFTDKEVLMLIMAAKGGKQADLTVDLDGSTYDTYGPITKQTIKDWDRLIKKLERKNGRFKASRRNS